MKIKKKKERREAQVYVKCRRVKKGEKWLFNFILVKYLKRAGMNALSKFFFFFLHQ